MRRPFDHPLVVCDSHPGHAESVTHPLVSIGCEVRPYDDEEELIEAAAAQRPSAIVYELRHQLPVDLAILTLVRRALPDVPLVVVAGALADTTRRALRGACTAIVTSETLELGEVAAVVRTLLRHARRHAGAALGVA